MHQKCGEAYDILSDGQESDRSLECINERLIPSWKAATIEKAIEMASQDLVDGSIV